MSLLPLRRSMVFIWNAEAMQLHGVFKVDSGEALLPSAQVPGGRPHHVSPLPTAVFKA
jgi:hypothetical protein